MIVKNYMTDFKYKSAEVLIFMLVKSIPKILKPKNDWPTINLTNSLFHSYGVMYNKYYPSGAIEEERDFIFNLKNNVWAFTLNIGNNKSDIYLALKQRLEKKEIYGKDHPSIEHVVFHEIGHQFYYSNGINLNMFDSEQMADIYANACMLNLYIKNKCFRGYYNDFSERSLKILEEFKSKRVKTKDLLPIAEIICRKYGVI